MTERKVLAIPLAMALMLAAAPAFAAGTTADTENPANGAAGGHENPAEMQAFSGVKVSMTQAIAAAQKQSNGKVLGATFETKTGTPMYDVTVFANNAEQMLKVDANSGSVSTASQPATPTAKLDQEDSAEIKTIQSAKTDLSQAVSAAEQKGGGKAIDASIEDHSGTTLYDIQTVNNGTLQAYTVDPQSGQVQVQS